MSKSKMIQAATIAAFMLTTATAWAAQTNTGCQGNCPGGDTVNNITNAGGAGGMGGAGGNGYGVGIGIGQGGSATAVGNGGTGIGLGGSVLGSGNSSNSNRNDNANLNSNSNRNDNRNTNTQGQGQAQGQQQGQAQGQSQSANNHQGQSQSSSNRNNNTATGGNASNHNSNTANGGNVSGSGNSSSSSGSTSSATNQGNNAAQAVTVNGDTVTYQAAKIPVATAYAPNIAPTAVCMGSTSAGGQGMTFGFSIGSSWTDSNCMLLEQVRSVAAVLGDKETAAEMMCGVDSYREARARTGKPCGGKAPASAATKPLDPIMTAATKPEYTDPIVRARLGLPPLK